MRRLLLALPFALLPLMAAQAAEHLHAQEPEHEHGHDSLGAHEHGVASLNVALDGEVLELQLESPAMNLLGFEHAASSAADQAKVAAAKGELERPVELFALAGGACAATEVTLQSPLFGDAQAAHAPDEHRDIHAHYRFACPQASALKHLDLSEVFKRFPATEKIQVQLIGPGGQQGAELTAAQPRLNF